MMSIQSHGDDEDYGYGIWLEKTKKNIFEPMFQGSDPGISFISSYDKREKINITIISNLENHVWEMKKNTGNHNIKRAVPRLAGLYILRQNAGYRPKGFFRSLCAKSPGTRGRGFSLAAPDRRRHRLLLSVIFRLRLLGSRAAALPAMLPAWLPPGSGGLPVPFIT